MSQFHVQSLIAPRVLLFTDDAQETLMGQIISTAQRVEKRKPCDRD